MRALCHEQAHQYTCQEERARLKLKDAQAPGYRAEAAGTLHRKGNGVKDQSQNERRDRQRTSAIAYG